MKEVLMHCQFRHYRKHLTGALFYLNEVIITQSASDKLGGIISTVHSADSEVITNKNLRKYRFVLSLILRSELSGFISLFRDKGR